MDSIESSKLSAKSSISTSRRNFVKGCHLALGAGVAIALSVGSGQKAHAGEWGHEGRGEGGRGEGGRGEGGRGGGGGGEQGHCFLAGTLIRTASGFTPVEDLCVGSEVLTVSGKAKPVKWIGKRKDASEAPVRISKFAIDGKAPSRDLFVSPRHALYIDGFLVPAINLLNGLTITAETKSASARYTYYHIEFDSHEVIEAEGLMVESYLPQDGIAFDNEDEYLSLYGARQTPMAPFAPILSHDGVRQELGSYMRSTVSFIHDIRNPLDKIRDRIADQADLKQAA